MMTVHNFLPMVIDLCAFLSYIFFFIILVAIILPPWPCFLFKTKQTRRREKFVCVYFTSFHVLPLKNVCVLFITVD